jgi:hypothetical protein
VAGGRGGGGGSGRRLGGTFRSLFTDENSSVSGLQRLMSGVGGFGGWRVFSKSKPQGSLFGFATKISPLEEDLGQLRSS